MQVSDLLTEYQSTPLAVDTPIPRFCWTLLSGERGQRQAAYEIMVASASRNIQANDPDMWASGKVESAQSTHIVYGGKPLESNKDYYWKVRVWKRHGGPSAWSNIAKFGTALLHPGDWKAKWIGKGPSSEPQIDWDDIITEGGIYYFSQSDPEESDKRIEAARESIEVDSRSVLLRKEIVLPGLPRRARVYVSGLGYYELRINGDKVGDRVLAPAKTHYRKQVLYDTYDITERLTIGANAVAVELGNGWFNPQKKYWGWQMQWFGSPRAILQMHIDYEDGATEVITSDATWKSAHGAIVASCIYDGETYDANLEKPGWDMPGYDDSRWDSANVVELPGGALVSQMMPAVKVHETITPAAVKNPAPGVYVYDMGQNFSGRVRISVKGPRGTKLVLRHAENIYDDGMINRESISPVDATDTYILKGGGGIETYEPRFTYHGFRYVEVTGFSAESGIKNLEGRVLHTACEPVGYFECSNELINRVHQCTLRTQRNNMQGLPVDCPQRGERLGWLGDAHITAQEAMYNFNMALFYTKWLRDIKAGQDKKTGDIPKVAPRPGVSGHPGTHVRGPLPEWSPAWSSGYLVVVWYCYLNYGDTRFLEEHYDNMRRYVEYLTATATGHILPMGRYGDWLSTAQGWTNGKPELVHTAYYYYDAVILSCAAEVLGKVKDARRYALLAEQIRDAFNGRYFNDQTGQYGEGTQFENAFPLFLGMVPERHKKAVLKNLVTDIVEKHGGHLAAGILGARYAPEALTQYGMPDVAYKLLTRKGYPGWEDMIRGRTTLSESWDQGGSNNHIAFGSIDGWLYKGLGGINIDERHPGYEKVIIKPYFPDDLKYVNASVKTIRGTVSSSWKRINGSLTLCVTIPAGSQAGIYLPARKTKDESISESGKVIWRGSVFSGGAQGVVAGFREGEFIVFEIGSGTYRFQYERT